MLNPLGCCLSFLHWAGAASCLWSASSNCARSILKDTRSRNQKQMLFFQEGVLFAVSIQFPKDMLEVLDSNGLDGSKMAITTTDDYISRCVQAIYATECRSQPSALMLSCSVLLHAKRARGSRVAVFSSSCCSTVSHLREHKLLGWCANGH